MVNDGGVMFAQLARRLHMNMRRVNLSNFMMFNESMVFIGRGAWFFGEIVNLC